LFVGGLFTSYSIDGGATWNNKIIADGTDPLIPNAGGWAVTASDGFGNLFVAYLNKVVDGNRHDPETINPDLHLRLQRAQPQEGRHTLGQGDEIRPHDIVKDMALHAIQCLRTSINLRALRRRPPNILDEDRQAGRVVAVRMSEEYVPYGFLLLRSAMEPQRSGINRHTIVDKKAADVLMPGRIAH